MKLEKNNRKQITIYEYKMYTIISVNICVLIYLYYNLHNIHI